MGTVKGMLKNYIGIVFRPQYKKYEEIGLPARGDKSALKDAKRYRPEADIVVHLDGRFVGYVPADPR